jgi:hypothetical protein
MEMSQRSEESEILTKNKSLKSEDDIDMLLKDIEY